ncbi:MAG: GNAT family N-acetyltransferase [Arachnia propionica]|nr:MAG: GNAT family N-acetyltransferase [Arachnia propionica]
MSSLNRVRLALPNEAASLVELQRRQWSLHPELARALAETDQAEAVSAWQQAIAAPPLATCRVLVALAGDEVVGFTATGPAGDPDSGPTDGVIAADGFEVAVIWLPADADEFRRFLATAGWGADGAHQELGSADGKVVLKLIRMHTRIAD